MCSQTTHKIDLCNLVVASSESKLAEGEGTDVIDAAIQSAESLLGSLLERATPASPRYLPENGPEPAHSDVGQVPGEMA